MHRHTQNRTLPQRRDYIVLEILLATQFPCGIPANKSPESLIGIGSIGGLNNSRRYGVQKRKEKNMVTRRQELGGPA